MRYIHVFLFLIEFVHFGFAFSSLSDKLEQCKPQQVHIAYGNSVAEMVIMWSTLGQCSTVVKYGTTPGKLDKSSPGENRMFESEWNKDGIKTFHMVKLRRLFPKTVYYYEPTSSDINAGPYFFTTPASDKSEAVQFMAVSNVNTTTPSMLKLLQEAGNGGYSALLHAGNIAMRLSDDGGMNGDRYMRLMEMAVKSVPYMTSPGPMEWDGDTFSQYIHRFSMPKCEWPMTLDRLWYSMDIGLVHLVSFSTEVFFTSGGKYTVTQRNWLISDLKTANENRNRTPWIVAFGYRPFYCSSRDPELQCNKNKSTIRTGLEDIMFHYGVDLVLTSNGEHYERSYPLYKGFQLGHSYHQPTGPIYVTLGSASPYESSYNSTEKDDWLAFRCEDKSVLSYGRLNIQNESLLTYEQIAFESQRVIDSFTIVQEHHDKFSIDKLPANVSSIIQKQIVDSGETPDDMDIEVITTPKPITTISKITKFIEDIKTGKDKTKLAIGIGVVVGLLVFLILCLLVVRRVCRGRRRRSARRWEHMDIDYGKRYYSKASDKDDMDNDFEIDVPETTEPSRKLLTDD